MLKNPKVQRALIWLGPIVMSFISKQMAKKKRRK